MQQTEHYELNQWDPSDRILREDFNADNAKLDAALWALGQGLPGRLARPEIIRIQEPSAETVTGFFVSYSGIDWDQWDYVGVMVCYPPEANQSLSPWFRIHGTRGGESLTRRFDNLSMSGYAAVLLPLRDKTRHAAGFLIANRFIPFTCEATFQELTYNTVSSGDVTLFPTVVLFGGR